jgi:hypothetical protein
MKKVGAIVVALSLVLGSVGSEALGAPARRPVAELLAEAFDAADAINARQNAANNAAMRRQYRFRSGIIGVLGLIVGASGMYLYEPVKEGVKKVGRKAVKILGYPFEKEWFEASEEQIAYDKECCGGRNIKENKTWKWKNGFNGDVIFIATASFVCACISVCIFGR